MTIEKTQFNVNFGAPVSPVNLFGMTGLDTGIDMPPLLTFASSEDCIGGSGLFMPDISAGMMPTFDFSFANTLNNLSSMLMNIQMPAFTAFPSFDFPIFNFPIFDSYSGVPQRLTGNMGTDIVSTAQKYIGCNERDGSYKRFTGGKNEAWCADFVSYVVKEAYRNNGKTPPKNFGSASVSSLKKWGKDNNCYLSVAGKSNKGEVIAQNVKPGDIVIYNWSHTGIVKEVKPDGTIVAINGNSKNGDVSTRTYKQGKDIRGFIQIA